MTKDDIIGKLITLVHSTIEANDVLSKGPAPVDPLADGVRYAEASSAGLQHLVQSLSEEHPDNLMVLMEVLNERSMTIVYPEVRLMQQWQNMLMTDKPMDDYYVADFLFSRERAGIALDPAEKSVLAALVPTDIVHPWPAGFQSQGVPAATSEVESIKIQEKEPNPTSQSVAASSENKDPTVTDKIINAALMKNVSGEPIARPNFRDLQPSPGVEITFFNPNNPVAENRRLAEQFLAQDPTLVQGGADIGATLDQWINDAKSENNESSLDAWIKGVLPKELQQVLLKENLENVNVLKFSPSPGPLHSASDILEVLDQSSSKKTNVDWSSAVKEFIANPDASGSFDVSRQDIREGLAGAASADAASVHNANENNPVPAAPAVSTAVIVDAPTVLRTPVASYQEKRGIIEDVALANGLPIVSGKEWRGTRMPRTAPLLVADFDFATIDRDGVGRAAYLLIGPASNDDVRIELKSQSTSGSAGDKLPTSVLRLVNAGATQSYGRAIVGVVGLQFFAPEALSLAREVAGKSARVRLVEGQDNFVEVLQQHITDVKARHAAVAPKVAPAVQPQVDPAADAFGPEDLGYDGP